MSAETEAEADADELSTVLSTKFDPSPIADAFVLTVLEGPSQGQRFVIDASQPSRTLIGQSAACGIRIADRQVSRRHAAVDLDARHLRLTDLGSTNGTHVNGVAIVEVRLRGGEIVRMGETTFQVQHEAPSGGLVIPATTHFGRVLGVSTEMRRLHPLCTRLAQSNVPVIIEGETGTGKEVMAEALHEMGPRAAGPFMVFDCTSVPPNLLESELFGHERGAFTGAIAARKGVFELAHGGTLLIDEIGDLDLALQPKLLRAVERNECRRVGGDRPIRFDVRLLAATRRDLDHEVQAGRFRDDLFHRLAVTRLELPPLRRRRGDIVLLANYFWKVLGGSEDEFPDSELLKRWELDPWPGNVRELRNAVSRRLALGDLARDMPGEHARKGDAFAEALTLDLPLARARERLVAEFEREYIVRVLAKYGGDTAKAAAASGIARRYFNVLRARAHK